MSHTEEHAHKGQFSLRLGERGRLVVPAEIRRRLSLETNDRLILTLEDGSFRVTSARAAVRRSRGLLQRLDPSLRDVRLSEELIAERRREAARE